MSNGLSGWTPQRRRSGPIAILIDDTTARQYAVGDDVRQLYSGAGKVRKTMSRILTAIILVCGATLVADGQTSQPGADARAIVRRADDASKRVTDVVYEAECYATGPLADRIPRMKGRVAIHESKPPKANLCRLDLAISADPQKQGHDLMVACDGQFVTVVDHDRKMYTREPLPKGQILINAVGLMLMTELASPTPFTDELASPNLAVVGVETVGGVACDVVMVSYAADSGSTARWYFAKSDGLPRRVDRTIDSPDGRTTVTLAISSMDITPVFDHGMFRLEAPDGYEKAAGERWGGPRKGVANPATSAPASGPASR